jgi:hypothetical protein
MIALGLRINQKEGARNIRASIVLIQLVVRRREEDGSNTEKRLFIIVSLGKRKRRLW